MVHNEVGLSWHAVSHKGWWNILKVEFGKRVRRYRARLAAVLPRFPVFKRRAMLNQVGRHLVVIVVRVGDEQGNVERRRLRRVRIYSTA